MPDDVTTPVVTPPSETSFINPDGTYKDGWKETLLPEELRTEGFYDSPFNANVKELLKTAGNQAKMLGKKGVVPITDKSSEFEVRAWRTATGVPDKYTYQKPADLKTIEIPDDFISRTLDSFNKANMTQAQTDLAMKAFEGFWRATEAEYDKAETDEIDKINQQILTEENTNYETNSHLIDNAVRQFTQGWADEDILKVFGTTDSKGGINSSDHIELKPLLRKFLVNVGKQMGEGRMVTGDTGGKSLQEQLDEVMKNPDYNSPDITKRKPLNEKALKLREQLNKQTGRV
jgi:hypothetical protein